MRDITPSARDIFESPRPAESAALYANAEDQAIDCLCEAISYRELACAAMEQLRATTVQLERARGQLRELRTANRKERP